MNDEFENETQRETPGDSDALQRCEMERKEYLEGWQRTRADFANYKKDEAKRFEEFAKYAREGLLREFIGVLDTFDLGLAAMEEKGPVEKGIYMIRAQIEDLLKRNDITRIALERGDPFDPAIAEAIATAESDLPEGAIVEEIEPGYRLAEKVIRPARVKVSKGTSS